MKMKNRLCWMTPAAVVAGIVGTTLGADCSAAACGGHAEVPDALAHPDLLVQHALAKRLLPLLPIEDRNAIIAAGGFGAEELHADLTSRAMLTPVGISPREYADRILTDELKAKMTEIQLQIFDGVVAALERGEQPPALCFAPGTDPEYAYAINQLIEFPLTIRFQQTNRWTSTATNGGGLTQGTPTTLTYSFVPDGTTVPNLIGVSGNSNLRAWLNGIYGNQATWQALFEQVFDRWSDLIGTTYVFEPNDDGSTLNNAAGLLGVRGDIRIAAITIDGNSGTLAYNNFPQDGDMVFDSADSFFNNIGNNSLRFRNVTAHEHGHGLGMLHVCPANQTKLMEPFVSTAYNGPQLDDILNGQRHYGDKFEPASDNPAAAPTLGTLGVGGSFTLSNVSIDDNSDQDFYEVTLTSPSRITVTVAPDAGTYLQQGQDSACNTGVSTNYNDEHNLSLSIYSTSNLFTPLATVNATAAGGSEVLVFDAESSGDYVIQVSGDTANSIQRYVLGGLVSTLPFLGPQITSTAPTFVDPGVATPISVNIDPRNDTLVGTPQIFFRFNGGAFQSAPMTANGGQSYTATLPAADCGEAPQFYFSAVGQTAGTINLPAGGASAPFTASVGEEVVTFADNFETNLGWTVSGTAANAAAGRWERAIPAGDGSRGDPADDFDGSSRAYITGNGAGGSNTDVDTDTTLTSPAFDVSGSPEASVSYARWYDNTGSGTGAAPGADTFKVQISNNNGSTWVALETVGPNTPQSSGGWNVVSFRIADFVAPSTQVRVRFIADDLADGSVVEAGVDAFEVSGLTCDQPGGCSAADLAEPFGTLNFFDVSAFLGAYNSQDPAADLAEPFGTFNFFDISAFLGVFNAGCP
jgi:hypothetical protein